MALRLRNAPRRRGEIPQIAEFQPATVFAWALGPATHWRGPESQPRDSGQRAAEVFNRSRQALDVRRNHELSRAASTRTRFRLTSRAITVAAGTNSCSNSNCFARISTHRLFRAPSRGPRFHPAGAKSSLGAWAEASGRPDQRRRHGSVLAALSHLAFLLLITYLTTGLGFNRFSGLGSW